MTGTCTLPYRRLPAVISVSGAGQLILGLATHPQGKAKGASVSKELFKRCRSDRLARTDRRACFTCKGKQIDQAIRGRRLREDA